MIIAISRYIELGACVQFLEDCRNDAVVKNVLARIDTIAAVMREFPCTWMDGQTAIGIVAECQKAVVSQASNERITADNLKRITALAVSLRQHFDGHAQNDEREKFLNSLSALSKQTNGRAALSYLVQAGFALEFGLPGEAIDYLTRGLTHLKGLPAPERKTKRDISHELRSVNEQKLESLELATRLRQQLPNVANFLLRCSSTGI